jgi:hypothetical protein
MNSRESAGQKWQQLIDAQPASGLSIAAYCRQHQLSQAGFFVWRRRLGGAGQTDASVARSAFVQVNAIADSTDAAVHVRLRRGRRLIVPCGFDRDSLIRLVQTLEGIP